MTGASNLRAGFAPLGTITASGGENFSSFFAFRNALKISVLQLCFGRLAKRCCAARKRSEDTCGEVNAVTLPVVPC